MKIIIYSHTNEKTISKNYGTAEYSYYFVLKEFLPVLERLGTVVVVTDPETEVDPIYSVCKKESQHCVFLSFSPPHKTLTTLQCPTIPVFAWEFEDIPTEVWGNDPRNDWRFALGKFGYAITHSTHTARAIKKAMRKEFPVTAIPSPVWDKYQKLYERKLDVKNNSLTINFAGILIDTGDKDWRLNTSQDTTALYREAGSINASGTIYTTVLNPLDGRKNWPDMVTAFCSSLAGKKDATLILKFTNKDTNEWLGEFIKTLRLLPQHQCRIIMINGFIDDDSYVNLARHTTYTVNASRGEGQCLPLMEYMSAGCPAISPRHTGMEDYISSKNSFIVEASLEPTPWPEDTRRLYRTYFHRVCWESLSECFSSSYEIANYKTRIYKKMAKASVNQLESHCSQRAVYKKLKTFFATHRRIEKISGRI